MALNYNAPIEGDKSSIDMNSNSDQMRSFLHLRKSMTEARRALHFGQLASVENMPKHYGKTMKLYHYIPVLDLRNTNDQGIDASGVAIANGNLYGSSRDIGTIAAALPVLSEEGGRVNRIGFTRVELSGTMKEFGVFYEFTKASLDFDTDDQLRAHLARELVTAAVQMSEAMLQMDLLASAGVVLYAGAATSNATITGEEVGGLPASTVDYADFTRLDQTLTENRTPKRTQIISGSRFVDTRVLPAARIAYTSGAMLPLLRELKNTFDKPALIEVQHYAAAGTLLDSEVGSIGPFRIIEVEEMLHWSGAGAVVSDNPGFRTSVVGGQERYDVYPILVVGDDSFHTIGFQTDGRSQKFNVMTRMPGKEAMGRDEPYGKMGISSLQFWYGFLLRRPERIAIIKTVAPL